MDSLTNSDSSKSTKTDLETKFDHTTGTPHTFVVTTIVNGENSAEPKQELRAVLVEKKSTTTPLKSEEIEVSEATALSAAATTSSQAILPLSTSLPSKLLRHHAKKSAQDFLRTLNKTDSPNESIDSQLGDSDESGAVGGTDEADDYEVDSNECADIFDIPTPTAPSMSPQPPLQDDEKLIDVGMGSSIECSEESEEDDELKPLAVDNHLLDVDLNLSSVQQPLPTRSSPPTAVLSEANLKKHSHHNFQNLDNIYLHPNFHYDSDGKDILETSPPPAVAPSNSPTEQKRVHRSFLTLKKTNNIIINNNNNNNNDNSNNSTEADNEKANSVQSHATTASTAEQNIVNEIDSLDPALIPSEELAAEITEAVEFYFSNESILKDAFLLKHVRRNKEGFVSLKLVSSFKRVRQLTKDWKVVGNAVRRKSLKIELNDVGTKVRRIEALPNFDETMPSRTIVACDLPLEKLTIEKVSDIFSKCGEIALIRILKPGMTIPVDVRQFMNKYPEMQQKECALVEYLESSSAREAKNLQGNFKVYEMVAPKKKTGKKAVIQVAAPIARMVENYRFLNDYTYERARGGSFSGVLPQDADLRSKLKRNSTDFHGSKPLTEMPFNQGHYHQHQNGYNPSHRGSFGSEPAPQPYHYYQPRSSISHDLNSMQLSSGANNLYNFQPRRYSSNSTGSVHNVAVANVMQDTGTNNMLNNNLNTNLHSPNCGGSSALLNTNNLNNNNNNNNNNNFFTRRTSNGSESFNAALETARRASTNCTEQSQLQSQQSSQRRDSNCSENCPCSRRVSDFNQNEVYRKNSQGSVGSVGERRYSNGSMQFERTFSNASEIGNGVAPSYHRRMSNDFNFERKPSIDTQPTLHYESDVVGSVGGGGGGYQVFPRRYSNNFNISSKLAAYDNAQYINGRRVSTDSGYDRRFSFGSEYEGSPRSRTGSFLSNYDGQPRSRTGSFLDGSPRSRSGSFAQRAADSLIRTPIGPDGSKGFGTRARKFGQTVSPVN